MVQDEVVITDAGQGDSSTPGATVTVRGVG